MAASTQRLFVALWPDADTRRQIAALQKQLMTRSGLLDGAVAVENLHLTLRFLGNVPVTDIDRLCNHLSRVSMQPFAFSLQRWGHFSRPGILWIGPDTPGAPLCELQAAVQTACREAFAAPDKHFRAHVTLFRKLTRLPPVQAFEPIEWPVDGFVLVASTPRPDGVQYRVLREFAL